MPFEQALREIDRRILLFYAGRYILSSKVVRVKSWEEFKRLIIKHKPESIGL